MALGPSDGTDKDRPLGPRTGDPPVIVGIGASAGGILAPQVEADAANDFFRLACASRDRYRGFARDLRAESGIDVELDLTATLCVAFTEEQEAEFRSRYDWQRGEGLDVQWLKGEEARTLEPCLSEQVCCAVRFPGSVMV